MSSLYANISSDAKCRRPGLPKKFEAYWFLQIRDDQVKEFRCNLYKLLPLITSAAQAMRDQDQIDYWKSSSPPEGQLLKLSGVNISFSHKGLVKVYYFALKTHDVYRANVSTDGHR